MTVESNWARIIRWCEQNAPTTATRMLPAADPQTVRDAESVTGQVWPEQLHQWFALHGGSHLDRPIALIIPGYAAVSAPAAAGIHGEMSLLWQGMTDDLGGTEALMAAPAGEETGTYLPAYIPIGEDGAGDYLVVDTRSGDHHGCVIGFWGEGVETVKWDSIDAMVDSIATALEQDTDCGGWIPTVENGALHWDLP